MKFSSLFEIFTYIKNLVKMSDNSIKAPQPEIVKLNLPFNTHNNDQRWTTRPLETIKKLIVHQELGNASTQEVHRYHISTESHLKPGVGAPRIAYHFTIEKDGTIYQVNDLTDIVWHCRGQNIESIGIMCVGNYSGPSHKGTDRPPQEQIDSLKWLLHYLIKELKLSERSVFGHYHFGKENCPGLVLGRIVEDFRKNIYSSPII